VRRNARVHHQRNLGSGARGRRVRRRGCGRHNFYAKDPSEAVFTLDLDVLLRPDAAVVRAALAALAKKGRPRR
jgi:hypothetical protein